VSIGPILESVDQELEIVLVTERSQLRARLDIDDQGRSQPAVPTMGGTAGDEPGRCPVDRLRRVFHPHVRGEDAGAFEGDAGKAVEVYFAQARE